LDAQRWLRQHFGCELEDPDLLHQALSHRSVGRRNNERLEFLGDAVLGYVISDELFRRFPEADEGELSRLRVSLVKGKSLASLARKLGLGDYLMLGMGERHGGGRQRDSILADTLEALFGAISRDRGFEASRVAILQVFAQRLAALRLDQAVKDPKTRLQEHLQGQGRPLPDYLLDRTEGEDHVRRFFVSCALTDEGVMTAGEGNSRRAAEQAAATAMLARLENL
jgi:ribonuclease-3